MRPCAAGRQDDMSQTVDVTGPAANAGGLTARSSSTGEGVVEMSRNVVCCGHCRKCPVYIAAGAKPKPPELVPPGLCKDCRTAIPARRRYCDPCRKERRRSSWYTAQTLHRMARSGNCFLFPIEQWPIPRASGAHAVGEAMGKC
jgi:hypothetical protein